LLPRSFPHPLFLGLFIVHHKNCWASDFTKRFDFLALCIFVYQYSQDSVDAYVIIKPKGKNVFTVEQIKRIYNEINLSSYIMESDDELISNKMLIFRLRIRDSGKTKFVMRSIRIFARTAFEIGLRIEDGIEYLYGLFSSSEDFERCKTLLKAIYEDNLKENQCILASKPGLQLEPPLFGETVMCNLVKFQEYRELLNKWMIDGTEFAPEDWNWKILEYVNQVNQVLDINPDVMDKARREKVPASTREKLERLAKDVTIAATAGYLAYWLKLATRFLVIHYFTVDIGDP